MNNSVLMFQIIILALLVGYFLFHSILIFKHKNYVFAHQNKVPVDFKNYISLKDHQKSASYVCENSNLNQINLIFEVIMFLAFTYFGGLNLMQKISTQYFGSGMLGDIFLVLFFITVISVLQIPFSIYKTFVIEQKFGFNKQTPRSFFLDLVKSYILSLVLIFVLLGGIFYFIENVNHWWIFSALFVISFNLIMSYLYPSFIAPLFNKFKPIEKGEFLDSINQLLEKCQFKNNGIFVMDGSKRSTHLNAYFTGFGAKKRIVLFDTLMEKLSVNELKSVLAHELGHYSHKHIQKRLFVLVFQIAIAFYLLFLIHQNPIFYSSFGVTQVSNGALIVLISLFIPIVSFFITPISSHFSRKHEFEADAYAASKTSSEDLITALLKLYKENSSTLTPHPVYSKCFDSHPPAKQRIDHLKFLKS